MKDELGEKGMKELVGLRRKTYSHLIDHGNEDKKAKRTKKFAIKRKLKFKVNKNGLEAAQLEINHQIE